LREREAVRSFIGEVKKDMTAEGKVAVNITAADGILNQAAKLFNERRPARDNNGYNIFEALRIERNEVVTHSRFLFSLLNKRGKHNCGDKLLRLFVRRIIDGESALDDKTEVSAELEHNFGGNRSRIDLLITAADRRYAVELKIDADEQPNQIDRYYRYTRNKVYFLTLDKRKAFSCSNPERVACISYADEIVAWLKECLQELEKNGHGAIYALIEQYITTIKKITKKQREDSDMKALITDKVKFYVIDELLDAQRAVMVDVIREFCAKLGTEIERRGFLKNYSYVASDDNDISMRLDKKGVSPFIGYQLKDSVVCKLAYGKRVKYHLYYYIDVFGNGCLSVGAGLGNDRGYTAERFNSDRTIDNLMQIIEKRYKDIPDNLLWRAKKAEYRNNYIDFVSCNEAYKKILADVFFNGYIKTEAIIEIVDYIQNDFTAFMDILKKSGMIVAEC
jgi:hypothetical protein